ncbi:hypothetical protein E3P86_00600 [Wallemia ichthyophaga]|uniref:Transcription initiation factor IIF subunit alpha n=1 Tax=Wallemia ichthyophaga TaxID=245174 RepID=A0A4T0JGA5_WALIC|nr:hypothetical protein E3P86_00600 [Wallemia ichthyophaga]
MSKPYTDYKLISNNSNGFKYNVMKLNSNKQVDLSTLPQPLKLNRKDPNHLLTPVPKRDESGKIELDDNHNPILIDPITKQDIPPIQQPSKHFKKKTKQVFMADESTIELRKSERLPWIMESGDSIWQGQLDGKPQDQSYVMLIFNKNHDFKVEPTNKIYKFNPQPNYNTLSIDEADQIYSKGVDNPWFMRNKSSNDGGSVNDGAADNNNPSTSHQRLQSILNHAPDSSKPSTQKRMQVDRGEVKDETVDALFDEMEFDEEFQDDDEHVIQDNQDDDQLKELEDKIKKEMHQANIGHVEQTSNLDDVEEDIKPFQKSHTEKEMKRFLRRHDKSNAEAYDSDNSDDDQEEEEQRKKEQEEQEKRQLDAQENDKATSLTKSIKKEHTPASLAAQQVARRATSPYNKQRSSSPSSKRSRTDIDDRHDSKKIKVKRESMSPSASPSTPPSSADLQLLQEDEIIAFLRGKSLTTSDLIQHFKKRFKAQPRNREVIGSVLKKVASRTNDGKLQLKEGL